MTNDPQERWIVIPRWDEFQHRDMARSTVPPWIKAYTKLMGDEAFLQLTFHQRGVLLSLWLEYATARRQLRDSTLTLTRRLGHRVLTRDLEALNHAGFIEVSASKPAGAHASNPASLEVEVEIEGFKKTPRSNGKGDSQRIESMIRNGALPTPVDLETELAATTTLTDEQKGFLRSLVATNP